MKSMIPLRGSAFGGALLRTLAIAAAASAAAGSVSAQTWVLFDNFSSTAINSGKWSDTDGRQYGATRLETKRAIGGGQLRLESKGFGDNVNNLNTSSTRTGVLFAKSSAITAMKATFTVRTATANSCGTNSSAGQARARMFGFFFNAGTPMPGSNFNDVYAGMDIYRMSNSADAAGVLRMRAYIGQCSDDSCINSITLKSATLTSTTAIDTPTTLSIVWDKASNSFAFQRDAEPAITLTYDVADTLGPWFPGKRLEVANVMPQCAGSRVNSFTAVDIDDVYTNSLPSQAELLPRTAAPATMAPDTNLHPN